MTYEPLDDLTEELLTAEDYKLAGDFEHALELLEDILSRHPDSIPAYEELAENELQLKRIDRATKAAKHALSLDPGSAIAKYVLGFIASQTDDWKKAITLLQEANKRRPNHPEILRCLGFTLFFRAGEHMQGVVTMERALNLEPENAQILCDLGLAYLHLKNFNKASALFERAVALEPDNTRATECIRAYEEMRKKAKV